MACVMAAKGDTEGGKGVREVSTRQMRLDKDGRSTRGPTKLPQLPMLPVASLMPSGALLLHHHFDKHHYHLATQHTTSLGRHLSLKIDDFHGTSLEHRVAGHSWSHLIIHFLPLVFASQLKTLISLFRAPLAPSSCPQTRARSHPRSLNTFFQGYRPPSCPTNSTQNATKSPPCFPLERLLPGALLPLPTACTAFPWLLPLSVIG